jgi:hypothetical protein
MPANHRVNGSGCFVQTVHARARKQPSEKQTRLYVCNVVRKEIAGNEGCGTRGSNHLESQKEQSAAGRNTGAAERVGADADGVGAANTPIITAFNSS